MNRSSLLVLHDYNDYSNDLVLVTAAKMTAEELTRQSSPSHGSVMNLLQHMFGCEYFFAMECMNCVAEPSEERLCSRSITELKECFSVLNATRRHYLEEVNQYELEETISVRLGRNGVSLPRWQFMAQSLIHSIHHRGELSIVMTGLGYPLPTLDPILKYIRDSGQSWE
jgi:uncharacterized damage-inducible protein DinB